MRYKLLILLIIFNSFILNNIIKAEEDYKVEYYFQDENNEDIYNQSEKDVYYNPKLDEDIYPTFEGYDFKKEEIDNNIYKLYYDIKIITITIDGNGGLYNNQGYYKIYKKYGEVLSYKDLENITFEKIGYEQSNYNLYTESLKRDIVLYVKWHPKQYTYYFFDQNKKYSLSQEFGNYINYPLINVKETFLFWIDENRKVMNDIILDDIDGINCYSLYPEDIKINKIINNKIELEYFDNIEYALSDTNSDENLEFSKNNIFDISSSKTYFLFIKYNNKIYFSKEIEIPIYTTDINLLDFDIQISNNEIIIKNIDNANISIEDQSYEIINDYIVFSGLSNLNYDLKINDNIINIELLSDVDDIKKHFILNTLPFGYIIAKNSFTYYDNNEIIKPNEQGLIEMPLSGKVYFKKNINEFISTILLEIDITYVNNSFDSIILQENINKNNLDITFNDSYNYYFISNNFFLNKISSSIKLNLDFNSKYYLIVEKNNNFYYKEYEISKINFDYYIIENKLYIKNNDSYQIEINDIYYNDENIVVTLNYNKQYFIKFIDKSTGKNHIYFIKTNEQIKKDEYEYKLQDNKLIIDNIVPFYDYYLLNLSNQTKIYSSVSNNKLIFDSLDYNTNYQLFCSYKDSSIKGIFGIDDELLYSFYTNKIPSSENILTSFKINEFLIDENNISFNSDNIFEYSIDKVNWFSKSDCKIIFSNLYPNTYYMIYARIKETDLKLPSNIVYINYIKTFNNKPSKDLIMDLNITDKSFSFNLNKEYDYFFNDNLITDNTFYIDNLDNNLSYKVSILRKDDDLKYDFYIYLKGLKYYDEDVENIVITRNINSLNIKNIKNNLKYILKDSNFKTIYSYVGDKDINFTNLNYDSYYNLFMQLIEDENNIYPEEQVLKIYIPYNFEDKINEFLIDKKIISNFLIKNKITENKNTILSNSCLDKIDIDLLYKDTVNYIKFYNNFYYNIINLILSLFLLIYVFLKNYFYKYNYINKPYFLNYKNLI